MNNGNDKRIHDVNMTMRKNMKVSGVAEVISFDDMALVLKTVCGEMTVEGREIKVGTLDTDKGVVTLEGKIDALYYSDPDDDSRRGLFGKRKK